MNSEGRRSADEGSRGLFERVSAILIHSHQAETLRAWYRDVLGLPLDQETNGFLLGDLYLGIDGHSQVSAGPLEPYRIMLSLDTNDIQADVAALKAKGVRFVRLPEQEPWGGMIATLEDPDGNYVQLMQLPAEIKTEVLAAAHGQA
jgi:catechol 2,3-dioxygenase-like lactoylglutathione lyase family enzyme